MVTTLSSEGDVSIYRELGGSPRDAEPEAETRGLNNIGRYNWSEYRCSRDRHSTGGESKRVTPGASTTTGGTREVLMMSPETRRIQPGMDVCDLRGSKIGKVSQVHHVGHQPDQAAASVADEVLEIKTGFLGLGRRLYVPRSAVQEVLAESLFLSVPKHDLEALGYFQKPASLSRVS